VKPAVLLVAHGAPERLEDVEPYLLQVRGGRPLPPHVLAEIKDRYARIGGRSPLLAWTRRQAEALQTLTGLAVYIGMRNWHPFLTEAMQRVAADGIGRLIAICMTPQYSDMSVGLYMRSAEEAWRDAGARAEIIWTRSFHTHPLLIDAFAERLAPLVDHGRVLFTAHSVPEKVLEQGDPYDRETRETAAAVADQLGVSQWDFSYQSQGLTSDKWLGPTVESCLDRYAAEGVHEVVLDPIGFVCDHVEILYDVDILFKNYAAERGIRLLRPESLNGSSKFTAALADIVNRCLP
jgi:protoporphyrin/coproporphyrin ferrochelatase